MAALQATRHPSCPHHLTSTPQPSLWLVTPPPTTYTWTKNGEVITDGGPYRIFIAVNGASEAASVENRYCSTLTVTGTLLGLYEYSVTNRAHSWFDSQALKCKEPTISCLGTDTKCRDLSNALLLS